MLGTKDALLRVAGPPAMCGASGSTVTNLRTVNAIERNRQMRGRKREYKREREMCVENKARSESSSCFWTLFYITLPSTTHAPLHCVDPLLSFSLSSFLSRSLLQRILRKLRFCSAAMSLTQEKRELIQEDVKDSLNTFQKNYLSNYKVLTRRPLPPSMQQGKRKTESQCARASDAAVRVPPVCFARGGWRGWRWRELLDTGRLKLNRRHAGC